MGYNVRNDEIHDNIAHMRRAGETLKKGKSRKLLRLSA